MQRNRKLSSFRQENCLNSLQCNYLMPIVTEETRQALIAWNFLQAILLSIVYNYTLVNFIWCLLMHVADKTKESQLNSDEKAASSDCKSALQPNDLQIMQKKAALYCIKNQLLKYDTFEGVSNEQLHALFENLHSESFSNRTDLPDAAKKRDADAARGDSSTMQGIAFEATRNCLYNLGNMKVQGILVVFLVVLCLLIRVSRFSYTQYNFGQFSIYETKYNKTSKSMPVENTAAGDASLWKILTNVLGSDSSEEKIKIYLPNTLQKAAEFKIQSYESCLKAYSPHCLDYKLTTYGSMNIELESFLLTLLEYPSNIYFEAEVEYFLSIIIAAQRLKHMQQFTKNKWRITVSEGNLMKASELNSLKLSIIENQCLNQVELIQFTKEAELIQVIGQHRFAFISQSLFFLKMETYLASLRQMKENPIYIVNMPEGMNRSMEKSINSMLRDKAIQVSEIKFNRTERDFFQEVPYQGHSSQGEDYYHAPRILVIKIKPLEYSQSSENSKTPSNTQPNQALLRSNRIDTRKRYREIGIKAHPCIKQNSYNLLPIQSFNVGYIYIITLVGFRLLVKAELATIYKRQGSLSPEILFFIAQNLRVDDKVFLPNDLFADDLLLMTVANTIRSKGNVHCLINKLKHDVLFENLRINGLDNLVSYTHFDKDDASTAKELYRKNSFTVYFASPFSLIRDYDEIVSIGTSKMVIFFWIIDKRYEDFFIRLVSLHRVQAILQKSKKEEFQGMCIDYGLLAVSPESLLEMDRVWLIVQI